MPHLKLFLLALSFYTRLPAPKDQDYTRLPQASVYLPLVGWLVGGLAGFCFYLADLLWPQTIAVILALSTGILLTGAFHEDGFADVCDGFGGGYDKQRILDIMKDSQIGAYGALGLLLLMSLKINLLSTMHTTSVPLLLLAGHSVSRLQPLLLMRRYGYARSNTQSKHSKGSAAVYKPSTQELLFAGSIAILPLLLLPLLYSLAIPFVLLVNWRLGCYFHRHIGGYTGDCLGASQQVAETVFYLSVSALWTFT
jgi:adenosylcobinamide-GDP ribazoletransferase